MDVPFVGGIILFTYLLGHSKNDNMMPNIVVKSDVFVFNACVQTTISKVYGQSYTPVFYGDTHVVIWVTCKMRGNLNRLLK